MRPLLLLAPLLGALSAHAAVPLPPPGLSLEARAGYAIPFGHFSSADGDLWLLDVYSGLPAVAVGIGWQLASGLHLGVLGQYGVPDLQGRCDPAPGVDCGAYNWRANLEARYHFEPRTRWEPWVGASLGYERTGFSIDLGTQGAVGMWHAGPEAGLSAGLDDVIGDGNVVFGPWVWLELGVYTSGEAQVGYQYAGVIDAVGPHFWFYFGLRGEFRGLI